MAEEEAGQGVKRDRSPAFPYIGLAKAVERAEVIYRTNKRHPTRIVEAARLWDVQPKSSTTLRTVAALQAYGLVTDEGSGDERKILITDEARRIFDDARPGNRERLLADAAMKPKLVRDMAELWKEGRPGDDTALSTLKLDFNFTDEGARQFLRVFDDAMGFTKAVPTDKLSDQEQPKGQSAGNSGGVAPPPAGPAQEIPKPLSEKVLLMEGERELATGPLSMQARYRLIVSGPVGKKEIENLIKKLEVEKDVLSDDSGAQNEKNA
jgi:hypothetical protein